VDSVARSHELPVAFVAKQTSNDRQRTQTRSKTIRSGRGPVREGERIPCSKVSPIDLASGLRFFYLRLEKPTMRMPILLALSFVTLWISAPLHARDSEAEINWRKSISAQIEGKKEFPAGYFGDGGTARLTCTIDRSGNLKSVEVTDSSGSKMLDEQALDMFHRAQPFQAAPDEAKGESFTFNLSMKFGGNRPPVDVELVIAADVSYSMGKDDLARRREAYAQAIVSNEFAQALKTGPFGKVAVTYFEWSASNYQDVIIPRREIDGPESAAAFAAEITKARAVPRSRTSISSAIDFAVTLFKNNYSEGARRVLDISGDGPNNDGGPVLTARDAALAKKITINGVTIMYPGPVRPQTDVDQLDDYFADCVTGGQGSFVLSVKGSADLNEAIRTALVSEVTGRVPERAQISSAGQEKRISCRKGEDTFERFWAMPPGKQRPELRGAFREDSKSPSGTAFATSTCFERLKYKIKNPLALAATIGSDGKIVGNPEFGSPIEIDDVRADVNAAIRILRQCQPYVIHSTDGARRKVNQVFRFGDEKQANENLAKAIEANFKKCWKPARSGPAVWVKLKYRRDGTYRRKPMLINPQDTEDYSRAAAWVTTQINKCPPVKFPEDTHPWQTIDWQFQSDESARSSRPKT
jgi:TonB family protein